MLGIMRSARAYRPDDQLKYCCESDDSDSGGVLDFGNYEITADV